VANFNAYKCGLNIRQIHFCDRYLANGFNGSEAATFAGYSKSAARHIASRLLTQDNVKRYIKMSVDEAAEKLGISAEYLLAKLKRGLDISIHDDDERETDVRAGVVCITEINKMLGHYKPTKAETENRIPQLDELIEIEREKLNN